MNHVRNEVKRVEKGWGYEIWVSNNDLYCGKQLTIYAGKSFSDHFHISKTETFYVTEGTARLMIREKDGQEYIYSLKAGDIVDVAPGLMHKVTATTFFTMMEFSTKHDDNDSYRISKGD